MGITEITVAAGWIAGLAILALIATGWRKTARAAADSARGAGAVGSTDPLDVVELDAPIDRPVSPLRRIGAAAAGGALAIWMGAVIATLLGFGVAYGVITLTHMLKR
ncbi:MAG: hypothetical protein WCI22_15505 [Actinomycetota bacterium]